RAAGASAPCRQAAGLRPRRSLRYAASGGPLTRRQRSGFIRFGSRADLYLPLEARPLVATGERVSATETVVARLPLGEAPAQAVPAASEPAAMTPDSPAPAEESRDA